MYLLCVEIQSGKRVKEKVGECTHTNPRKCVNFHHTDLKNKKHPL